MTLSVTVDFAGVGLGQLAADHELCELASGHVLGQHGGDGAAGADHRDGVGDAEHLIELVADEDDSDPLRRQIAERVEQVVDLLRHEHGGRLVEDEDARSRYSTFMISTRWRSPTPSSATNESGLTGRP